MQKKKKKSSFCILKFYLLQHGNVVLHKTSRYIYPETKALSQSHEDDPFKLLAGQLAEFQKGCETIHFNTDVSVNIDEEIVPSEV